MKHRKTFERGESVRVKTLDRGTVERIVVEDRAECVVVSTADGFAALERGEDAAYLGFPRHDVEKIA